jgi:hypothetical protein
MSQYLIDHSGLEADAKYEGIKLLSREGHLSPSSLLLHTQHVEEWNHLHVKSNIRL